MSATGINYKAYTYLIFDCYGMFKNFFFFYQSKVLTVLFITTNRIFVAANVLLRQAYFCRDKRLVLSRQTRVCHNKSKFVMTKIILVAASANDRVLKRMFVCLIFSDSLNLLPKLDCVM